MTASGAAEQRVFLHVGAPKTGTTFLQTVMYHYRDRLRELGYLFPGVHYDDHFFAAVDLQDLDFSGHPRPEASGRWEQVAAEVRAWPGTSVISHDVLAGATPEQAQRAIESLAPATVHIVCTARDLAQQIPSHWQEDVKHGQVAAFDSWYARVMAHDDSEWQLRWFWRAEHVPDMLRRWSATLQPEQVHVITVPRPGAPPSTLWRRFSEVIGLDPGAVDLEPVHHHNRGLGMAEIEVLRRINATHAKEVPAPLYERVVKGFLAHEVLAPATTSPRPGLPAHLHSEVLALAEEWLAELRTAGYNIVGDVAELLPEPGAPGAVSAASEVPCEETLDVAADALFTLLLRLGECRDVADQADRLRHELAHARSVIDEHQSLPNGERIKRTVVEIGRRTRSVAALLWVYRRLRRRR